MRLSSSRSTAILHRPQQDFPLWDKAGTRPSLDQQFADRKDLVDTISGQQLITHTRASAGTYRGSDGLIKTATTNEARFDHDPVTGESLGLLVEELRANEFAGNDDIPSEFTGGATRTSVSILTPDGNANGHAMLTDASAFATNYEGLTTSGTNNEVDGTVSFYAKKKTTGTATLTVTMEGGGVPRGFYSGAINSDTWTRVTATKDYTGATSLSRRFDIYLQSGNSSDGDTEFYVCFVQFENGSFPTSYIPTTGSTASRSADVVSITGANFSSWIDLNDGTFFSDSKIIAPSVQTQAAWSLTGGTYITSLRQPQGATNQFRAQIGNVFTPTPGTGNLLSDGTTKACVAYSGTAGRLQVGSSSNDVTSAGVLDATDLHIGSLAGGTPLNGTIRRITYWPARLPNETLQTITQ